MTSTNPFEIYFLDIFKFKFAQFTGRARRSEYWYFVLFNLIVSMGLGAVDAATGLGFLSALYGLIAFIPGIAVAVRRLHDTGKSGLWLLIFLIFEREYSTGVYLLSPGTETIGSMLVSLWAGGAIDIVAALSFVNIVLVAVGLGIALRFGVKLHD